MGRRNQNTVFQFLIRVLCYATRREEESGTEKVSSEGFSVSLNECLCHSNVSTDENQKKETNVTDRFSLKRHEHDLLQLVAFMFSLTGFFLTYE